MPSLGSMAFSPLRFKARTSQPASRSWRAVSPPMPPVAPRTRTLPTIAMTLSRAVQLLVDDVNLEPSSSATELQDVLHSLYIYVWHCESAGSSTDPFWQF